MSVEHYSPYFAQELLSIIINEINEITRQEDILQAKRSIEALNNEIENTQINEVVTGLNDLIQKQIEIITIANASPEYLFKVMSPPVALERKSSPKRSILAILFFLISFSAVCMVFLLKDFYKDSRKAI